MEQMMQMLANDRIDVAVNDLFSGLLVNARLGLDRQLRPLSPPLQHIDLYHFLHVSQPGARTRGGKSGQANARERRARASAQGDHRANVR